MRRLLTLHVLALALAGLTGPARASSLPLKDEATARNLYLTKCSKCHKLYDPAGYPDAKWDLWMEKMSRKAKLTPEQERLISTYVQEQLRHRKPPGPSGASGSAPQQ